MPDKKDDKNLQIKLQPQVMSSVLDNIGSYVYSKDLEGKYTYVNADVAALFQTSVQDILGKDDSHFFDLAISDQLRENDLKVIRDKVTITSEEKNVIKSTGKVTYYRTIKKPIFDEEGLVIGLSGISMDNTEQKNLEAENNEQKNLLNAILDNVDAHIYIKDTKRYYKYVNRRVAALFGKPPESIIGKRDLDVMPAKLAAKLWKNDKLVFESNKKIIINETLLDEKNNLHHYLSTKIPYNMKGGAKAVLGFSTDVTELYQLKEKFEQLANVDELTQLYNRRYFFENANKEFNRAKRYQQALSVISIDVDHFKAINDQYGHPVGDQVLREIAKVINPTIRDHDIFARIGGEEFSILLPNTTKQESQNTAERIRLLFDEKPISLDNNLTLPIKISLGISVRKSSDSSFQDLYARSDIALYKAKDCGRNHVYTID